MRRARKMRKPLLVFSLALAASVASGCSFISFSIIPDSSEEPVLSDSEDSSSDASSEDSSYVSSEDSSESSSSSSATSSKESSSSEESSSEESSSSSEESSTSEGPIGPYTFKDTSAWWSGTGTSGNYIDTYQSTGLRIDVPQIAKSESLACYYFDKGPKLGEYITYGEVYTVPDEVALYYCAYRELPPNYGYYYTEDTQNPDLDPDDDSMTNVYNRQRSLYGSDARLYTDYSRSGGYVTVMPALWKTFYYEVDLAITSNYGYGSGRNRGAGRLIIFPDGVKQYSVATPFIVKTYDHYDHFREFSNMLDGWGKNFDGKNITDEFGSYTSLTTLASPYSA